MIDVNEELKMLEQALRDIIVFALNIKYGASWIDILKITDDRKNIWKQKMEEESKRLKGNILDNRIIYYSDFYDLETIIDKHWDDVFKEIFYDKKQLMVFLEIISTYRVAIAHNRELLEHQKNLLVGISGTIRRLITEYKADKDSEDNYYPKFQSIIVNGMDIITPEGSIQLFNKKYHVGDEIEVIVNVITPPDIKVTFAICMSDEVLFKFCDKDFSNNNRKIFKLSKKDIPRTQIHIAVKSNQDFHRCGSLDLGEEHSINVLPIK